MDSLMHPQGPESEATYWKRRALVVLIGLVALALAGWLVSMLFGGGRREDTVSAVPQNTPLPAGSLTPSGSVTPSGSATPSASGSSSPSAASSGTPAASASSSPTVSTSSSASATPSVSATPTPTPAKPSTPEPSRAEDGAYLCDPSRISLTLTGDATPKIGAPTTWQLTWSNPESYTCRLDLAKNPLSLVVQSGADRIWTTAHCGTWGPTGAISMRAKTATTSTITWTLQRSAASCTLRPDELRAGTYVVNASVEGGQSARFVMNLRH